MIKCIWQLLRVFYILPQRDMEMKKMCSFGRNYVPYLALAFQLTAVCTYHFLPIHSLETLQTPSPEKSVLENMGFFKCSFIEWKVPNVTLVSYVPNVSLKRHVYVNLVNFGLTLLKHNLMLHRTRSFLWM